MVLIAETGQPHTEVSPPGITHSGGAYADQVAACAQRATWSVEERDWTELAPGLPAETIALLAPPVVVSAEACDLRLR